MSQLNSWFQDRLKNLPPFEMSEEDYQSGTDELPDSLQNLVKEAFDRWLEERKYELSYQQICRAFFVAAKTLNKLTLVPRHPTFRLNTPVFIKEVYVRGTSERALNVPAVISSVRGDEHVVTGAAALGDEKAGSWCVILETAKLEDELTLRNN